MKYDNDEEIYELPKQMITLDYEINPQNALNSLREGAYLNDEVINLMVTIFEAIYQDED